MANPLRTLNLSAAALRKAGMPDDFVVDYMYFHKNMQILSTQVQLIKTGTQATTGAYAPLTGWTTERNVSQGITIDSAAGTITVLETGDYIIDAMAIGSAATGIAIKVQHYTGGAWSDVSGGISQNPQQATISGLLVSMSKADRIRIEIKDTGGAVNIVSGMARITVGRRS